MQDDLSSEELRNLWAFADPVSSERVLRLAAEESSAAQGRRAELHTQVARAMGLQGRFAEAHQVLDGVDAATPRARVRVLLERGRLHRSAGQLTPAVPAFEAAAAAAERDGLEGLLVDALHMLAVADPDRAAAWTARAMSIVHASADPETRRWAVALANNQGWDLMDRGLPADALVHFAAAHAAAVGLGGGDSEQVARWAIARCLRELGRTDEAVAMQRVLATERPDDPFVAEELAALAPRTD